MHRFLFSKIENRSDLTTGPVIGKLLLFFFPVAIGMLFQQLYNAVDAFVVGKCVGTGALAAVGGSPAIVSNLIIGFCTSLAGGSSVVMAQLYGAKKKKEVASAVKTSYLFCSALGILVGAAVILFSPQILSAMRTPADTMKDALIYQRIYFSASLFILIYNMGSGILQAVGNSRFPFICLFVSCGVNIALDLLFVIVFHRGVAGVAWATVIAQGVSAGMVTLRLVLTKDSYRLKFHGVPFDLSLLFNMMRIGIPSGAQTSMYGISNLILQVGINSLSTVAVASYSLSGKIDGVYWAVTSAFGVALTTFVGQNYGAHQGARIRETTRKSFLVLGIITVCISGFLLSCGRFILSILTEDPAVIATSWKIMLYFVPTYLLWSIIEVVIGVLRGIGDVVKPAVIIASGICVFRILWVWLVYSSFRTLESICICYPVSWLVTDVAILLYFRKKYRALTDLQPE